MEKIAQMKLEEKVAQEMLVYDIRDSLRTLKATEYGLVFEYDIEAFRELVNSSLAEGWRCQGGVCIGSIPGHVAAGPAFLQAIVRFKEDDSEDEDEDE